MNFQFTDTQLTVAVVSLFLVVALLIGIYLQRRKTRTLGFRDRFGSEYDRAVLTHGTSKKAEARLATGKPAWNL